MTTPPEEPRQSIYGEVVQPFIDLVHAPRALWGVNLAYTIEGLSYFGILTYLTIYFSDYVFKGVTAGGVSVADEWSHAMVGVLTAGIAISMVVLGFIPDKWGVRPALIGSFVFILLGRVVMSAAPTILGLQPGGVWSALHVVTMVGIVFILIGYGIYQPAAYSAVRQFTTPKTAAMAYAMLYALMNAGSSLAMLAFLLRDDEFLGLGITGTFWVYTALTLVSLVATILILSRRTVQETIARAKAETAAIEAAEKEAAGKKRETGAAGSRNPEVGRTGGSPEGSEAGPASTSVADGLVPRTPVTVWVVLAGILLAVFFKVVDPWRLVIGSLLIATPVAIALLPAPLRRRVLQRLSAHPLADAKFFFFIFALIPVQTLFTYNWLVLPQYISRAYAGGWIGDYFEIASNANPVLIFILVPVLTALTYKANVYNMMIAGTFVMGASAFVLGLGASPATLCAYILLMTVGEAMWSARFLQYATEIAPEGRAGQYQGVAQLPWFLTKFLVPLLYSGRMMERYCPAEGPKNTETMWLIFGLIAVVSPILLILAKGWLGRDFKTKADR